MASEEGTEAVVSTRRRTTKPVSQPDGTVKEESIPELEGPQVRYDGPATRRILGPDDWKVLGVDDTEHKTFVWDLDNSKSLPKEQFSPQQLDYLRVDGRFQIDED
jgi:hypothetical protein